jgi:hypothetical protein
VTLDELLARLDRVKRAGDGWMARCPAHEDGTPSLSITEGDDGRVLLKCHAGCATEEIVSALGLSLSDLFEKTRDGTSRIVETYDYVDEQGALLFQVVRKEPKSFPQRRPDGRGGWIWKLGRTRRVLYRLPAVLEAVAAGKTIYVVEGEKDVHALEVAGHVATCNPMGEGKWRAQYGTPLRGANVIVVQDKDDVGRKHAAEVVEALQGIAATVQLVESLEGKDAADHLAAGHTVDEFVHVSPVDGVDSRTNESEPASLSQKDVHPWVVDTGWTPPLALERDILAKFREDLHRAGVAGEERLAVTEYLALTSRVLSGAKPTERPVSPVAKGSTSTGKSHTTATVLRFFPSSAYIDLGSMSRKYLFYLEEEFAHRFLVVPEWASIKDDEEIVAMLRTLLSEGRIVHGTVEGDGKRTARRIEKSGPTGLLMTTTAASVDPELETRCLSIVTDDSTEQTGRVFAALAALEDELETPVDFAAWQQFQEWLAAHGDTRVHIGFTQALAKLMPKGATRLRRDFVTLLCLIRSHAILYRAQRQQDEHGRIVATIEGDYKPVRKLVAQLLAEAAEAGVSQAVRDTVEGVRELQGNPKEPEPVSPTALAKKLGVGRSATYNRIHRALNGGYLANVATKDERRRELVTGTTLPSDQDEFLPTVEAMSTWRPPVGSGRESGSTMRPDDAMSTSPPRPPATWDETTEPDEWLAGDGVWRSFEDEPPSFTGEIIDTRFAEPELVE